MKGLNIPTRTQNMAVYRQGFGPPVLLVHGVTTYSARGGAGSNLLTSHLLARLDRRRGVKSACAPGSSGAKEVTQGSCAHGAFELNTPSRARRYWDVAVFRL